MLPISGQQIEPQFSKFGYAHLGLDWWPWFEAGTLEIWELQLVPVEVTCMFVWRCEVSEQFRCVMRLIHPDPLIFWVAGSNKGFGELNVGINRFGV